VTALSQGTKSFAVTDINGDQCQDLMTLSTTTKAVSIFRNQATGLGVECTHGKPIIP